MPLCQRFNWVGGLACNKSDDMLSLHVLCQINGEKHVKDKKKNEE